MWRSHFAYFVKQKRRDILEILMNLLIFPLDYSINKGENKDDTYKGDK